MLLNKSQGSSYFPRRGEAFRVEFLIKSRKYTQEKLTGISEEKHKIPMWIET